MIRISLPYGKRSLIANLPTRNLMQIVRSKRITEIRNLEHAITSALQNPLGSARLGQLARKGSKVAIVIDDATRPTPTRIVLRPILKELHEAGVRDKDITIVIATGLHRKATAEEKVQMIGREILTRVRVVNHDAHVSSATVRLGVTTRGTPVLINKTVAGADLRVLTGHIAPHSMAGYTGGGKSILPGASGMRTIIADHGFEATADPKSILGQIKGNPIREDIEEAAKMVGPSFIVNVVIDSHGETVKVVAGDMVYAHRTGTEVVDRMAKVTAHRKADVVISACGYPKDISLYQATCGIAAASRLPAPIIKKNGVLVLVAECREGIGSAPFQSIMSMGTPEEILRHLSRPHFWMQDQWAAQIWSSILTNVEIIVVTDQIDKKTLAGMNISHEATIADAMRRALNRVGKDAQIIALPDAPYVIPVLRTNCQRPESASVSIEGS
jgi:nickel-dependent lactate racemase